MDAFKIQIAGLVIQVQPMCVSTVEYCRPYLTDREAEFYIEIQESDLVYEQQMAEEEAIREGIRIRKYTNPHLERAAILRKVAMELLNRNTILFHGSTVGVDGKAYLFTAPCGTGKSTHTRLWREVFGDRAVMINDDKPFLQMTGSGVFAYGSPWSGKHGLDTNVCFPLQGICFLERGAENRIQRAGPSEFIGQMYHQCMMPEDPDGNERARALVEELVQNVPLWRMQCNKNREAAFVAHEAMASE